MTAKFNPGQAEVAYVAEVQYKPAVAPTVTLTLSLRDTHMVCALLGHLTGGVHDGAYWAISELLKEHDRTGLISFIRSDIPIIDPDKAQRRY